jgi:Caspase domain
MASCALIIGIDAYPAESGLPPLSTAAVSARRMAHWLGEQGWVAPAQIQLLCAAHDPDSGELPATHAAIREALVWLQRMGAQARPDDRLYLFYAGHAVGQFNDQLLLLPQDVQRGAYGESALPWAELETWLGGTGFRTQLSFLDICHAEVVNLAGLILAARLPLDQPAASAAVQLRYNWVSALGD